jgi:DNA-binding response OmpR family regulator
MQNAKILWVDDEIDLLKPHILFLQQKGMFVTPASNGQDALEFLSQEEFDIIFLDENMPGMNGLETLQHIRNIRAHTPVIMITKSEEENLMNDALGSQIKDYLIKPVNPNQILLVCKKILTGKQLVSQKVNREYQKDFRNIGMAFTDDLGPEEWAELYKKLVFWELQLENSEDKSMLEILQEQKAEANVNFTKFIMTHYLDWVNNNNKAPLLSPNLLSEKVFPHIKAGEHSLFFILIDCLRYDQWKVFEPIIAEYFNVTQEETYYSILPTATQYARNAIFSGYFPEEIAKKFPKFWVNDDEEGGKNLYEAEFLKEQIISSKLNIKHSYNKILTTEDGNQISDTILNLTRNDFNVIVINFIDLLSHARSEMNIIKELAPDEPALRSLSRSWFIHSSLLALLKKLKDQKVKIIISTDHGTIRVKKPIKIIGDRSTTTNLRYKQGKNLNYDEKSRQIFSIKKPEQGRLPKSSVSATYAFATEDCFFVYPNNYNYYANFYNDTFQHGGISLEEMIIPIAYLSPK